jgi:uncharacterized protein
MDELARLDFATLRTICDRYGIGRLDIFGSVARGTDTDGSDLDLLYELLPGRRLGWEIEDLNDELNTFFGRKVDLVSKNAIHRLLRAKILDESKEYYAA